MDEAQRIIKPDIRLRWYQEEIFDDIFEGRYRKILYIAPRRSGKDHLGLICGIYQALQRTCLIYHVLPEFAQARRCIFDAINDDQKRMIDLIPQEAIKSINHSQLKITLHNNSQIHGIGGDRYDKSLVGTNPYGIILSEYALMDPQVFNFVRPIIASNRGWCLIISTPRGKNHLYHLYQTALKLPDWKVILQKTSEIKHIPEDVLAQERAQMDEELYLQEYECDFNRGVTGSFYMSYLDTARREGRITHVPYDPGLVVHAVFDIGVNDPTTIIWFQVTDSQNCVRIIDCYSNNNLGMDHYARILQEKPYRMGSIYAPHDIKVREFGAGAVTRYEQARQLGVDFVLVEQVPIIDGIENVWRHFNKVWIDQAKCRSLIDALENYRKEWNEQQQMHLPRPVKSWACHYADAFRYLFLTLHKTQRGMTYEEFERDRAIAMYGNRHGTNMPNPFGIPFNPSQNPRNRRF